MDPRPTLPRRDFALVFAVLLVVAAGNTALQSVLPAVGRELGAPDLLIAVIFSVSALLWTFAAPYWARQSDLRGRRRLMELGLAGYVVSMLLCSLLVLAGLNGMLSVVWTFGLFTLARGLFGLLGSASNPAAQAYVASRTDTAERTAALSTLASAFGLGTVLGPALGSRLVAPFGFSGPMFVFAALAGVVLLTVRRLLPDDDPTHAARGGHGASASMPTIGGGATGASAIAAGEGRPARLSVRDSRVRPFMLFGFLIGNLQAATGQALGFLIIDRTGLSPKEAQLLIGHVFMVGAGATLLAQWGLIRMLDLRPRQLVAWGAALAAVGTAAIAVADDFTGIATAFAVASVGYGFARPGFTAGASLAVGHGEQGAVAGAVTAVNGAAFIVAPTIGIGLYELHRTLPYWLAAASLIALLVYALLNPVLRGRPAN